MTSRAPRVKRTCCGGFLIRQGVLCLLLIQVIINLLGLALSALTLSAFLLAVETTRPDGTIEINLGGDTGLTGVLPSRQHGVILYAVLTGQFAFSALWTLVGYVSARRRMPRLFLAYVVVQLLASLIGFVYSVVAQGWTWSQGVIMALTLYWSYVYYRYATATMPKEIEEEAEIKERGTEETDGLV